MENNIYFRLWLILLLNYYQGIYQIDKKLIIKRFQNVYVQFITSTGFLYLFARNTS